MLTDWHGDGASDRNRGQDSVDDQRPVRQGRAGTEHAKGTAFINGVRYSRDSAIIGGNR
jgi:hypothetical protein